MIEARTPADYTSPKNGRYWDESGRWRYREERFREAPIVSVSDEAETERRLEALRRIQGRLDDWRWIWRLGCPHSLIETETRWRHGHDFALEEVDRIWDSRDETDHCRTVLFTGSRRRRIVVAQPYMDPRDGVRMALSEIGVASALWSPEYSSWYPDWTRLLVFGCSDALREFLEGTDLPAPMSIWWGGTTASAS